MGSVSIHICIVHDTQSAQIRQKKDKRNTNV